MRPNPLTRSGIHLATAAVAGPALVVAGLRYPGSWKAKAFLTLTGAAVLATHYQAFRSELPLLTQRS